MKSNSHSTFFNAAIKEAKKAFVKHEVPVGAVIVKNNKIIARGHNLKENKKNFLFHAEVIALMKAQKKIQDWRLSDCELFVTLEPCAMCASILQQARIKKVFYAAKDPKGGSVSLLLNLHNNQKLNHRYEMEFIEIKECGQILTDFFKIKRSLKKK